jgi:hypothetical protein
MSSVKVWDESISVPAKRTYTVFGSLSTPDEERVHERVLLTANSVNSSNPPSFDTKIFVVPDGGKSDKGTTGLFVKRAPRFMVIPTGRTEKSSAVIRCPAVPITCHWSGSDESWGDASRTINEPGGTPLKRKSPRGSVVTVDEKGIPDCSNPSTNMFTPAVRLPLVATWPETEKLVSGGRGVAVTTNVLRGVGVAEGVGGVCWGEVVGDGAGEVVGSGDGMVGVDEASGVEVRVAVGVAVGWGVGVDALDSRQNP